MKVPHCLWYCIFDNWISFMYIFINLKMFEIESIATVSTRYRKIKIVRDYISFLLEMCIDMKIFLPLYKNECQLLTFNKH